MQKTIFIWSEYSLYMKKLNNEDKLFFSPPQEPGHRQYSN